MRGQVEMESLKVSTRSNPNLVAGAMANVLRRHGVLEVTVVGAGALNQAIKAVAIARHHVAAEGIDAVCVPSFVEIDIDGASRTAILLRVEHRAEPVIDVREAGPTADRTASQATERPAGGPRDTPVAQSLPLPE